MKNKLFIDLIIFLVLSSYILLGISSCATISEKKTMNKLAKEILETPNLNK